MSTFIMDVPHQVAYLDDDDTVDIPSFRRCVAIHTSTDPKYYIFQNYRWKPTHNKGRKPKSVK